jgi:hypothetical protein
MTVGADGSDEHMFCGNTTMCSSSVNCKYGCKPSKKGPVCYCPIGKEYNGTECIGTHEYMQSGALQFRFTIVQVNCYLYIDSNECLLDGACDQICRVGQDGKKECECAKEYERVDGVHCKASNNGETGFSIPILKTKMYSTTVNIIILLRTCIIWYTINNDIHIHIHSLQCHRSIPQSFCTKMRRISTGCS